MTRGLTLLVLRQLATSIEDETLRVDKVDPLAGLLLGQALELEEAHELHGDTNTGRTSAEEEDAVIGERTARCCA